MKLTQHTLGIVALVLVASLAIYARFHDSYLKFGQDEFIEAWGDGLKTYTNAIYHVRHSSNYTFFEGMNYPYPEHIIPATELPGLAIFWKFVNDNIFPVSNTLIIDSQHALLMFGLLLSCLFMYLIFRDLGVGLWFAIIAAVGLTFLAPQTFRLKGHFGLAVVFVLPAIMYLLQKFERNKHWKYSLWIALTIFISSFLHFYFFALCSAMIGLYLTTSCVFEILRTYQPEKLKIIGKHFKHLALMVGPPLVFFSFFLIAADPVTDRSPKPFGFLHYRANYEGFIVCRELPLFEWIHNNIIKIRPTQFEGRVYIGLVSMVFLAIFLLKWIWQFLRAPLTPKGEPPAATNSEAGSGSPLGVRGARGLFPIIINQQPYLWSLFFAGLGLAFLACAFPFSITGLEWLVDYSGPLQQFRSLGRFGWVFYFSINIIAFTVFYQIISNFKNSKLKFILYALIISTLVYEAYQFTHIKKYSLSEVPYWKEGKKFTEVTDIDFSKYQAILPIPYFNVGSNGFEHSAGGFPVQRSFAMSIQTGLPVTGVMLPRSSRSYAFKQNQVVLKPYRKPVIFDDYESEKPLLMIWHKNMKPHHLAQFEHLLDGAELLFEEGSLAIYELPLSSFEMRIEKVKDEIKLALEGVPTVEAVESERTSGRSSTHNFNRGDNPQKLYSFGKFHSTDSVKTFIFNDFETESAENPYSGTGAFERINTRDDNILFDTNIPNQKAGEDYLISFWSHLEKDRFAAAMFIQIEEIASDGKILQTKKRYLGKRAKTLEPNGWVLSEFQIKPKSADSKIRGKVRWNKTDSDIISIDNLLIRPSNTTIYQKGEDFVWANNLHFEIKMN